MKFLHSVILLCRVASSTLDPPVEVRADGLVPFSGVRECAPAAVEYGAGTEARAGARLFEFALRMETEDIAKRYPVPMLEVDAEVIPSDSGLRLVRLGALIARTREAVVFGVTNDNFVIKYQSNCMALKTVHPLIRDFAFLQKVEHLDISPRVVFLSPPIRLPLLMTAKTDFRLPPAQRAVCSSDPDAHVRYMVMERASNSLHLIVRSRDKAGEKPVVFRDVIITMMHMITGLETMHTAGVIHGDVHWGNVVVMDREGRDVIGFIDFGCAVADVEQDALPPLDRVPRAHNHCWLSHWNIEGYRFGKRDDIFKAILAGAHFLNGMNYLDYCHSLQKDVEAMLIFKRDSFMFVAPGVPDRIAGLVYASDEERDEIRRGLEKVLALARSPESVNDIPPYQEIVEELARLLPLVEKGETRTALPA